MSSNEIEQMSSSNEIPVNKRKKLESEILVKRNIEVINLIGSGGFGSVYKVKYENKEYALKATTFWRDPYDLENDETDFGKSMMEVANAFKLGNHENIVQTIEYFYDYKVLYQRMELCECSLSDWFELNPRNENYNRSHLMFNEISFGLKYIHENNIVHRDLKPQNILISKEGICKIADFGLSVLIYNQHSHTVPKGTILYAPPEQIKGSGINFKTDIYPMGLIFMQFFTEFNNENERMRALGDLKDCVIPDNFYKGYDSHHIDNASALLQKMVAKYPNDRPSIEEVISDFNRLSDNNGKKEKLMTIYLNTVPLCIQYDFKKIVCGMRDKTIKIYDRKTLQCLNALFGHTGDVSSLQFNNRVIISGSFDYTLRVWDVESGKLLNTLNHHTDAVRKIRFNNNTIVSLSYDNTIAIWKRTSDKSAEIKKVLNVRDAITLDFDENYIISGCDFNTIKIWKTSDGGFVRQLKGNEGTINCLHYRYPFIVSGSEDKLIRLWDIEKGESLRVFSGHEYSIVCIQFDDKRIISGDENGTLIVWDLADSHSDERLTFKGHNDSISDLKFNDSHVISCSIDKSIQVWNYNGIYDKSNYNNENNSNNWQNEDFSLQRIIYDDFQVTCVQFGDTKVISGMRNNSLIIWDRNTRQILNVLNGHTDNVDCLQCNDKLIISGSRDETVRIWDFESGRLLNTLKHKSAVRLLRFNNNIIVVLLIGGTIAIYNIKSMNHVELQTVLNDVNGFVLDLGEKYIISNNDNEIKVWNISDYQFVCSLNGHEGMVRCLHHCNSLTVSGSEDKNIRLWNVERSQCLRVLKGHELPVLSLRFDNKCIASGDMSGIIKVWDLKAAFDSKSNNVCLTTLKENNSILWDIQINHFQIISFSWDHSIVIWDFSGQQKIY